MPTVKPEVRNPKPEEGKDFSDLVQLMSDFAKAKNCLSALETHAQTEFLVVVDDNKEQYALHQETVTETEAKIEAIARRHEKDWFRDSKTIRTPFGSVSLRTTTSLAVPNEEATILLIERRIELEESEIAPGDEPPSKAFLREKIELNLEALEKLSDAELKALRITRVSEEKCTVKESKVDLGKAVKAAAVKEAA
jgi:hypothetical protein